MTFLRILFSKGFLYILIVFVEILVVTTGIFLLCISGVVFRLAFVGVTLLCVRTIIVQNEKCEYKLAWIVPMLIFPYFGGIAYLLFTKRFSGRRYRRKMHDCFSERKRAARRGANAEKRLETASPRFSSVASYITAAAGYFPQTYTDAEYYPLGEVALKALTTALKTAQCYIYLEFFIIEDGVIWREVYDILQKKARSGVDVRLIYDGAGCLFTTPLFFRNRLEKNGIKCMVFNPVRPLPTYRTTYRNHRKIVVIDGKVVFSGGFNLADEYANIKIKYGHWKDSGFSLRGNAVEAYSVMFEGMWSFLAGEAINRKPVENEEATAGCAVSYSDTPFDSVNTSLSVITTLIARSRKSIYITTPYLICCDELISALSAAAQSGVDVKIITPHIPDKKFVFTVTRSYYKPLINAGVRIYEYTPGFIHAKNLIFDGECAVIGTINLDFRSLFLNLECASLFFGGRVTESAEKDFTETLALSEEISAEECDNGGLFRALTRQLLRFFAPLM